MNAGDRSTAVRVEAVEIKTSLGKPSWDRAETVLGLDRASGRARRIYFCESSAATADHPTPLLDAGIILRLRENSDDADDSTVKVRPFPPPGGPSPRDSDSDSAPATQPRVEADWVGDNHVTAASMVAEQQPGEILGAAAGTRALSKLFTAEQEAFLHRWAPEWVELDSLRVLRPVDAVKWTTRPSGFPYRIAAERWEVDHLTFLELSIRVEDPLAAQGAQRQLESYLRAQDLGGDTVQETKTRLVLEHLTRSG